MALSRLDGYTARLIDLMFDVVEELDAAEVDEFLERAAGLVASGFAGVWDRDLDRPPGWTS